MRNLIWYKFIFYCKFFTLNVNENFFNECDIQSKTNCNFKRLCHQNLSPKWKRRNLSENTQSGWFELKGQVVGHFNPLACLPWPWTCPNTGSYRRRGTRLASRHGTGWTRRRWNSNCRPTGSSTSPTSRSAPSTSWSASLMILVSGWPRAISTIGKLWTEGTETNQTNFA